MSFKHPVNIAHHVNATLGERAADKVASGLGSWKFLFLQSTIIIGWIGYNGYVAIKFLNSGAFDPAPFILLNLLFSTQAAYAAPILQLSGNRQSQKDRLTLEHTYADTQNLLSKIEENTKLTLQVVEKLGIEHGTE